MLFSKNNSLSANFVKILCLTAMFFCVSNTAVAQDDDEDDTPQNVLKLNVGSLFLAHGNVAYQRGFGKHFAVQIGGLYGNINVPIGQLSQDLIGVNLDNPYVKSINYEGWGLVPTFRYYPLNVTSAPRGWYLEAFGQYRHSVIKNCVDKSIISNPQQYTIHLNVDYWGVGLGTGYQFMFGRNKNIVIDAMVGLKYSNVSASAGWEGKFKVDPIANPSGGYFLSPDDTNTFNNYVNNSLIGQVNNRKIGLGFLTAIDIFRSALFIGYAF
jgi:Autotransporter beta-domain